MPDWKAHLESGKVDDIVDVGVLGEDLVQGGLVGDVDLVEERTLARDQLDAVDDLLGRVVQVVDDDDLVVGLKQSKGGERANVAGATVNRVSTPWFARRGAAAADAQRGGSGALQWRRLRA